MFFRSRRYSSGANEKSTIHTYSSSTAPNGRFRFERPNSAPLPSSSLAAPSPPVTQPGSQASLSIASPFLVAGAASSGASTPQLPRSDSEMSDVSTVEERLKIIKRNRVSGKLDVDEGPGTLLSLSKASGATTPVRLPKHEQHVVDAMISDCLDALLFPSAL